MRPSVIQRADADLLYAPGGLKSEMSMGRSLSQLSQRVSIEEQKDWRGPEFVQDSIRKVHAFLGRNTPK